jgi:peptidoglycan/xylan/chitin deacetylase (PgdA/CDA1 family)
MRHLFIAVWLLVFFVSCAGIGIQEPVVPSAATPLDRFNKSNVVAEGDKGSDSTSVLTGRVPLVTFVFDDGNDTDYLVAREIFAAQGVVACSAVTTDWINRPGYLSADQIVGLRDAGWEIMSHSATHPNLRTLTAAQVEVELSRSKSTLERLGLTVKNIVYPFNKSDETVRMIARKYYRSGRGGKNELNRGLNDLYDLRSVSNPKHDVREMKGYINRAYREKSWLIIYHHQIDARSTLTKKRGKFAEGEPILFSPSGARGRHRRDVWFLTSGTLNFIPLAGRSQPGDSVIGTISGTTARVHNMVYDQRSAIAELVRYVRTRYPDMRIVTIDQGLDIRGETWCDPTSPLCSERG